MKLKPVVASLVMLGLMTPAFGKGSAASQQAVIDQNSVISPVCSEGWAHRITVGGLGSLVGVTGNHDPSGAFTNANNSSDLYANNLNLLVNADLSNWSKATLNLAYFGSPVMWGTSGALVTPQSNVKMHTIAASEAYVQISDLKKYPFFLVVGKKYVPFGDYSDPYVPYQLMSPAQMLAQTNAPVVVLGVTTDFGFYGNAFAFRGVTRPEGSSAGNIRNFGFKLGYYDNLAAFNLPNSHLNFAVSYINNLWDSEVFSPDAQPQLAWGLGSKYNGDSSGYKTNHPAWSGESNSDNTKTYGYNIDPASGLSVHADFTFKAFTMSANWVGALKKMVNSTYSTNKYDSSKFWGADVNADYAFKTLNRDSHLGAGIQWSGNGAWFGDNNCGITDWTRIIPKWRLVGEYKINIFKNTDLGLAVAHGKSYDFVNIAAGNDGYRADDKTGSLNTTVGLARLMIQL